MRPHLDFWVQPSGLLEVQILILSHPINDYSKFHCTRIPTLFRVAPKPKLRLGSTASEGVMLKGLGGLGDMAKIMKQAQEMQGKMAEMQEALNQITVTGESGAGLVTATATAKGELTALNIDPSIFDPNEKEVVEDLILAAVKDAQAKAQAKSQEEMAKLTEGLNLPEGMKLPF